MNSDTNAPASYEDATGALKATLRNDLLFHYILQRSKKLLTNLVCCLKGLNPDDIHDVVITNPINYAEYTGKLIILDVRIMLNNSEILDLELQVYNDPYWENRSLLYLCRAFNSLDSGENYKDLKPTTLITLMDYDLFPENPEFYSPFLFMHEKKHYPYSTNLRINVLYLNRAELATDEDRANKLDFWAELFKSNTWEELRSLADVSPIGKEVAEVMYEATIQSEEKTIFEAHQRYLDCMTAAEDSGIKKGYEMGYDSGYDTARSELQPTIDMQKLELMNKDQELENQKHQLESKDQEIARLKELLNSAQTDSGS